MTPLIQHPMKPRRSVSGLAAAILAFASLHAHATTINWGSNVFDSLANSEGQALDSSYKVELGVFVNSFVPTADNTADWAANWKTFDLASFNTDMGYFTGTADLKPDGSSSSAAADLGVNFADMEAYVWVFNDLVIEGSTQWFLGRSDSWVMPHTPGGCCDSGLPAQWSTSDLTPSDTPVFGGQGAVIGGGYTNSAGNFVLQTYNVVPEPAVMLLSSLGLCLLFRRRVTI